MACSVCYEEDLEYYDCSNDNCNTLICHECFNTYANICNNEYNSTPICPNPECKCEYLYNNVGNNDIIAGLLYQNIKNDPKLENLDQKVIMLNKLKMEKFNFLSSNLPKCVSKMGNICFKKKLQKISKTKEVNVFNKKCFNSSCYKGILNENYECNECNTIFCNKCERIKDDNHECKKEDLDAMETINSFRKCPTCKIPIFKDEGCDHMTCIKCKTKFCMSTGEINEAGSVNKDIVEKKAEDYKLSKTLGEFYNNEIIEKLIDLELLEPKKITYESILKLHLKIEDGEDKPKLKLDLFKKYSKYKISQVKSKKYFKAMAEIEQLHIKGQLTLNILKNIRRKLV